MQYNSNYKERNLAPFYFRKTRSNRQPTSEIQNASQYLSQKVSHQCSSDQKNSKHDSYHRYLSKKKGCLYTPIIVTSEMLINGDEFEWESGDEVYALSDDKRYYQPATIVEYNGVYTIQFFHAIETVIRSSHEIEPYIANCSEVFMSNGKVYVPDDFDCTQIVFTLNPKYKEQIIINKCFFKHKPFII